MRVKDLMEELKKCSPEAEVVVDIEVESGFYDVPARHARGVPYYVQSLNFLSNDKIKILAKSV